MGGNGKVKREGGGEGGRVGGTKGKIFKYFWLVVLIYDYMLYFQVTMYL